MITLERTVSLYNPTLTNPIKWSLNAARNEEADKIDTEAVKMPFIGLDCGIQTRHLKQAINKWEDNRKASH